MSANQACFPVATMARVLGVSKAGFYAWLHCGPSVHAVTDAALLHRVRTVQPVRDKPMAHHASMPNCGHAVLPMAASGLRA